ncbi:histone-fold-containing protein [Neolentinus lepideus HHB14362 ss-1]|uniref:DNA polymerase epsilon subunit D n=1 Tax=Neolentinus lepideus HHB14362 ss-1 TaxID=1314782 RepID=A0A165VSH4_9AGAM|nr:histone-fold-containing protein [Neolentinus lepideus HHB14362 ss-1]
MPRTDSTSNASKIAAPKNQPESSTGIESYELPRTLVTKIAKSAIPENTKLQKEVVTSLVKGSTVFINYLAATAHDVAASKQHKSISATDVLRALELLEFADMVPGLQSELQAYRDNQKKGRQSGAGAKGKTKDTVPTEPMMKGKGKEKLILLPPAVSQGMSLPNLTTQSMPDETETEANAIRVLPDEDEEMLDAEEGDIPEEEIPEDEPEDEDEELADDMAVEEEELNHDAIGLGDSGGGVEPEE